MPGVAPCFLPVFEQYECGVCDYFVCPYEVLALRAVDCEYAGASGVGVAKACHHIGVFVASGASELNQCRACLSEIIGQNFVDSGILSHCRRDVGG